MEEEELLTAAQRGDLAAFNELVLAYQDQAYHQAQWVLHDPESAEDITQDAFVLAYRNLSRYRGGSFRAWLMRIVTNASLDELRRRKRRPALPMTTLTPDGEEAEALDWLADPGVSIEELVERSEVRLALQRSLDELPEEYRTILVLVDVFEFDYAEAAQVLRIPIGTVKSRLARARLRLRDRLLKNPDCLPTTYLPRDQMPRSEMNPALRINSDLP